MTNGFLEVEWTTDDEFRVVEPRFLGDSELTRIAMAYEALELTLVNRGALLQLGGPRVNGTVTKVICEEPQFVSFDSDHLQNVIEDVLIFPETEIERARNLRSFSGSLLFPTKFNGQAGNYMFITPKVGVNLFAATGKVKFLEMQLGSTPDHW
jgi:hypothetical protein